MRWLWIPGVLLALVVVLLLLRVGVHAVLAGADTAVDAKVGPFRFRVYPWRPLSEREKRRAEEKAARKAARAEKQKIKKDGEGDKSHLPKLTPGDLLDAGRTLFPPLKRALGRTRRGIRIHPLRLAAVVGGAEDPAAGAELYGYLNAAVWTGMPVLEQLLVIPDPHIDLGVDFDAPETHLEGEITVTARVGTLLAAALGVGFPALGWFLRLQKRKKSQQPERSRKAAA
ncbi:MAG: DUF2953 domain-containing protein [Oscillibacter sp.]|nr:DUF2953 domain-containing protein [Oscillibacter sp.]